MRKLTEEQFQQKHRNWHKQPASEPQKIFLMKLGVKFPPDITLAEARDAISRRVSISGGGSPNISLVTERSKSERSF